MNIEIRVEKKIATVIGSPLIVCGNDDYVITFTFDEEWDKYNAKTARFTYTRDGKSKNIDTPFIGNTCPVPVLSNINRVEIGVYAGDVRSTTVAVIMCEKSILCAGGAPEEPNDNVYGQIMELFNKKVLDPNVVTVIDQKYNPESENPQSGKAVAQALGIFKGDAAFTEDLKNALKIYFSHINGTFDDSNGQIYIDNVLSALDGTTQIKYTITNILTNASNSNFSTYANSGYSYSATITADDGYILDTVTCTMGGAEVEVVGGVINIENVTGDIVITATTRVDQDENIENAIYIYDGFFGNTAHTMYDEPVYNSSFPTAVYTSPILLEFIDDSHPNVLEITDNATGDRRVRAYDENGNYVSINHDHSNVCSANAKAKYIRYVYLNTDTTTDGKPFNVSACKRTETLQGGATEVTEYTVIDRRDA